MAETARFGDEEDGRVGLVDVDCADEEDGGLKDAGEVFRPSPAQGGVDDEGSGDDGA